MLVNTKYWVHWFCSISRKLSTQGGGEGSGGILGVFPFPLHSLLHTNLELLSANNQWTNPTPLDWLLLAQWRSSHISSWSHLWPCSHCSRTMSNHSLFPTISGDLCYRITSYRILPAWCSFHGYSHPNTSNSESPAMNWSMLATPCCR